MTTIFIECGTAMASPFNTGIQRVVRNIVRESKAAGHSLGHQCVPVKFVGSDFYVIDVENITGQVPQVRAVGRLIATAIIVDNLFHWVLPKKLYIYIRHNVAPHIKQLQRYFDKETYGVNVRHIFDKNEKTVSETAVEQTPPILLLLDSTWDMGMWKGVDEFRAGGGRVCAVLYDLIPFTHPDTVEERTRDAHTAWWKEAPLHLDSVICISQTVRDGFLIWQEESRLTLQIPTKQVGYFYLGSELRINDDDDESQLPNIFLKNEPYFLIVGSIEPRKNHGVILDAFEKLWDEGIMANLVIVGANGWKSDVFLSRVKAHPMFKRRLFLLRRTADAELSLLYSKTVALIIASIAEGFGLPIVEAFQRGARVICSDIPVFREVAGTHAIYFDPHKSSELADKLATIIQNEPPHLEMLRNVYPWITWRESATQLIQQLEPELAASRK